MNFFKRAFLPKELRALWGVMDELEYRFREHRIAFQIVRSRTEHEVLGDREGYAKGIRGGVDPRQMIYTIFCLHSAESAACGEYHVYRGVLNPMGPGVGLVAIFEESLKELLKLGAILPEVARGHRADLQDRIAENG